MSWYEAFGSANDLENVAKAAAGNWQKFDSFAWHDRYEVENPEQWMIFYTHNRDSGLLEQSNAAEIAKELEKEEFENDVRAEHHGHWACGWIRGYAIRVFDKDGNVTAAFREVVNLANSLADYPVLNESDYSEREVEAAVKAIKQNGKGMIKEDAPEDWADKVYSYLSEHNPRELENSDDQGAYPSEDSIRDALEDLDLLEEEEE